jgi:hypothetical protein
VHGWIDLTRKTIASSTVTLDSNTPIRAFVSEWDIRLDVNGVPSNLDEGIAIDSVGSGNVWSPVTNWLFLGAPYTALLGTNSRWVDIVTVLR